MSYKLDVMDGLKKVPSKRRFSDDHSSAAATFSMSDDDEWSSVASQQQLQISELKALLKERDRRLETLERQVARQYKQDEEEDSVETQSSDDDVDDEDSQVREQIAAVKASLQQGRQHAQANQVSLTEEIETCRRLQQKLANRKGMRSKTITTTSSASGSRSRSGSTKKVSSPKPKPKPTLTQQLSALIAAVQEREQSMSDIAHSFTSKGSGTIPVSLYQAEIQQWKQALNQLSQDTAHADTVQKANQLLQEANDKMEQMETALTQAQQESLDAQAKAQTLWQMVQKYEQDKEEEIHLLDIVMAHLREVEEDQQRAAAEKIAAEKAAAAAAKKAVVKRRSVTVEC